MKSEHGPPATLGSCAGARVRLIVWCKDCRHRVEPDPAEMAQQYGAATPGPDWRERLICSQCGSRQVDILVSGTNRGSATAGMRTPSPEPEPKRQTLTAPFGEQSRATGLQMPRASSTIPAPAMIISEAAPAPAQKPAAQSSA
jgi:hypothetical protein